MDFSKNHWFNVIVYYAAQKTICKKNKKASTRDVLAFRNVDKKNYVALLTSE